MALFAVALATAWSAWRSRCWLRPGLPGLVALPFGLAGGLLALLTGKLHQEAPEFLLTDWFWYTLSWVVLFVLGAVFLIFRGLRRVGDEPAGRHWARGKLAAGLAGAVLLLAMTFWNLDLAVRLRMASARLEAGQVLLAMTPSIAERDDAALVYREAFAVLTPWDQVPESWRTALFFPPTGKDKPRFDPKDRELHSFLRSQEKGLVLLRKAAAMPACSLGPRLDQDFDPTSPLKDENDIMRMWHASQFLVLDAWAAAADGDGPKAVADIAALLGMARQVPHLFSLPWRHEKQALSSLRDVLAATTPPPEDLVRLSFMDDADSLRRFEDEEAAYALIFLAFTNPEPSLLANHYYEEVSRKTGLPRGLVAVVGDYLVLPVWRVFLMPDDLEDSHRTLEQYQHLIHPPHQQPYQDWKDVQKTMADRPSGLFTLIYLRPRLKRNVREYSDIAAYRQLARLAIALVQYKSKHHKYPDRLDELVPEQLSSIPLDPRNGQPFRLEHGAGVTLSPSTDTRQGELVFRLR